MPANLLTKNLDIDIRTPARSLYLGTAGVGRSHVDAPPPLPRAQPRHAGSVRECQLLVRCPVFLSTMAAGRCSQSFAGRPSLLVFLSAWYLCRCPPACHTQCITHRMYPHVTPDRRSPLHPWQADLLCAYSWTATSSASPIVRLLSAAQDCEGVKQNSSSSQAWFVKSS